MAELKEKLCSLEEAASLIKDGSRIYIGGQSVHQHPMALVRELIRKGVKNLTIVGAVSAQDVDILVGAGCVKRIEISYVGLEEFGPAPCFRRAVENGELELREYSEIISFDRFVMASKRFPFFPTREIRGTDIPKYNPDIKEMVSPYDGQTYHLIPSAEIDWAILHAPMADAYGNVLYFQNRQQPADLDINVSRVTRNIIVTADQIVDSNYVYHFPHLNLIPRLRTKAVVWVPFGAHCSSCLQVYDQDREHLKYYAQVARDPVEFKKYLDKYVYGVKSHTEYLNLIGIEALMKIRRVGGNL